MIVPPVVLSTWLDVTGPHDRYLLEFLHVQCPVIDAPDIITAGHEPWPRLLQNLRASCETDWVEKYPSHVVAKWLGHSPKVAAQHYLMSREHHFDDVVAGGGAAEPNRRRSWAGGAGELQRRLQLTCNAKCDAAGIRVG